METINLKNETLLKRLEKYDEKYYDQVTNHRDVGFGYGMRAYHRLKTMNPPHWKTKEKAEAIKEILRFRGVHFTTTWV